MEDIGYADRRPSTPLFSVSEEISRPSLGLFVVTVTDEAANAGELIAGTGARL
jgi:hypothetical protein